MTSEAFSQEWAQQWRTLRRTVDQQLSQQETLLAELLRQHQGHASAGQAAEGRSREERSGFPTLGRTLDDDSVPSLIAAGPAAPSAEVLSKVVPFESRLLSTVPSAEYTSDVANGTSKERRDAPADAGAQCTTQHGSKTTMVHAANTWVWEDRILNLSRTSIGGSMMPKRTFLLDPTVSSHLSALYLGWVVSLCNWWMNLEEPKRSGRLHRFITQRRFEIFTASVILANAVFTVRQADIELQDTNSALPTFMIAMDLFFHCFYTFELGLKIAVHRLYFFCNEDMMWNTFDTFLILISLFDQATLHVFGDSGASVTFARSLRLFKLAKVLRMFRLVRFLRELRMMMESIMGSFVSLFWSFVMISMILYIFGLVFAQAVVVQIMDEGTSDVSASRYASKFGTVTLSVLTLYQTTTSGVDWQEVFVLIETLGTFYSLVFVFYIAFWNFAVMNILTGIFVDNAMRLAEPDREQQLLEQRRKEWQDSIDLKRIIVAMDYDGSGTITREKFSEQVQHRNLSRYLSVLGLDVKDVDMFFDMLVKEVGETELLIDDFVAHCMRLKGSASSIDVQGLVFQMKILRAHVDELQQEQMQAMREQSQSMRALGIAVGMNAAAADQLTTPSGFRIREKRNRLLQPDSAASTPMAGARPIPRIPGAVPD